MPNLMQVQQLSSPPRGGRGKKGGKQQNSNQKKRPRAPFSADGPVHDKTKSTIVVESIPEENFDEEQVRGYFSQFGEILEVSMQPYKRLAIVKFSNWAEANAAYKSPKVIFDNRFVKVFWFKDDETSTSQSLPKAGSWKSESHGGNPQSTGETEGQDDSPEMDMEEFLRKQEEAQKVYEDKAKKLQEVERQRQELEKRQQELLARQREEKAKLEAKLAKRRNGGIKGEDGDESKPAKPMTQTEALRAQLAALEEEAKLLGIDPDAVSETSTTWSYRGRYGRGRGSYRARGYTPRGAYRGGFLDRGSQHAAYAAYSLDNRPKKVTITGVDFTDSEKDETLRQYLFVSSIPPNP